MSSFAALSLPQSRSVNLASAMWDSQTLGMEREENNAINALGLMQFIPQITPSFWQPHHLAPVIRHLERALHESLFLVIALPPRHGKTELILHFIAWYLAKRSEHTIGYTSYAQRQAESKALKAHRYAMRAGVVPDPKMQNRAEWRTAQGGGILSTGIGGPLTGQGLNGLVIDDALKNREDANSLVVRDKQWDWFQDVAETRLEPGAWTVLVMTRWHQDDLSGRVMKHRKDCVTIRIPALADGLDVHGRNPAPDLLGRKEGQALWKERYNEKQLARIRERNPLGFASLYQGLPRPKEDYVFGQPTYYTELPKEGLRFSLGSDLAYTIRTSSDHSVLVKGAEKDGIYYIIKVSRWRKRIGDSIEFLKEEQKPYKFTPIGVESNGPQTAVCDMLEDNGVYIERLYPSTDKYVRALPFVEAWNAGRVQVPSPDSPLAADWLDVYLEELMSFTGINDASDDQVDASVNAYVLSQSQFSFKA
jgi:predicted phage terminase large subunit-like protein